MQIKKDTVKEYFKKVNTRIEKQHAAQALWSIPDTTLRLNLRAEIATKLIPAYKQFWDMYLNLSQLKNPGKHFRRASLPPDVCGPSTSIAFERCRVEPNCVHCAGMTPLSWRT